MNKLVCLQIFLWTLFGFSITYSSSNRAKTRFTKDELKAIDKFRPMVRKHLTMDFQKLDMYLLRWIRGSNFDLELAAQELQKHYNWRKENKIDSILNWDEAIPTDLPYSVEGHDKGERPIVFHPFGKWNIRKYVMSGKQDVILRQYQRMYEDGIRKAFSSENIIDQIYVLTDLQGYNFREHSCLACIPVTLRFASNFAAGTIPFSKNITLVNSPWIFQPVLSLARSIITKVPIRDYDTNKEKWQKVLLRDVNREQLPPALR